MLRWAVEGCREYLEHGLKAPAEVVEATQEYRAESDVIGRFLTDCCVVGNGVSAKGRQLHQAFTKWAEESGEKPLSETFFCRRLKARGFVKTHTDTGNEYSGVGPRA